MRRWGNDGGQGWGYTDDFDEDFYATDIDTDRTLYNNKENTSTNRSLPKQTMNTALCIIPLNQALVSFLDLLIFQSIVYNMIRHSLLFINL